MSARTRRRRWPWVMLLALAVSLCACSLGLRSLYLATSTYTITYRVSGAVPQADVTYFAGATLVSALRGSLNRVTQQVRLPWERTVTSDSFLNRRSAHLQVAGPTGAALTCEVWIDGKLAETRSGAELLLCGYDEERNPVP